MDKKTQSQTSRLFFQVSFRAKPLNEYFSIRKRRFEIVFRSFVRALLSSSGWTRTPRDGGSSHFHYLPTLTSGYIVGKLMWLRSRSSYQRKGHAHVKTNRLLRPAELCPLPAPNSPTANTPRGVAAISFYTPMLTDSSATPVVISADERASGPLYCAGVTCEASPGVSAGPHPCNNLHGSFSGRSPLVTGSDLARAAVVPVALVTDFETEVLAPSGSPISTRSRPRSSGRGSSSLTVGCGEKDGST